MLRAFLASLLLVSASAFAVTFDNPTVDVGGVPHKILDSNDQTGEWYESGSGYCHTQGLDNSAMAMSVTGVSGPYAALDAQGNVTQVFADLGEGNSYLWVITQLQCQ